MGGANDDVAHLDGLDGDAPGVRPLIDELLQLFLVALAAAQQIRQRRPADDVAERRLRRPTDRLLAETTGPNSWAKWRKPPFRWELCSFRL
jgi:hypothetical protein